MHLVFDCVIGGVDIRCEQNNNKTFNVIYGLQRNANLTYEDAARELGECILHAKSCESLID